MESLVNFFRACAWLESGKAGYPNYIISLYVVHTTWEMGIATDGTEDGLVHCPRVER